MKRRKNDSPQGYPFTLFPEEVLRLLSGRKTQIRVPFSYPGMPKDEQPYAVCQARDGSWVAWFSFDEVSIGGQFDWAAHTLANFPDNQGIVCPLGGVGDQLIIRETVRWSAQTQRWSYVVDGTPVAGNHPAPTNGRYTIPRTQMPVEMSRLCLRITGIRSERLLAISEADAIAQGFEPRTDTTPAVEFASYWVDTNGAESFSQNPWVWVFTFTTTIKSIPL